jgi:hypothetical protein
LACTAWVNGLQVANAAGLIDGAPLAGELVAEFER